MHNYSRRRFLAGSLQSVAAGLFAATALPSCTRKSSLCAERHGSKIRFGLVTYLWAKDWDIPTLIRNCESTRVLGVELRTQHAHGVESGLSAGHRQEVKKRFADSSVNLVGLGTNFAFHHTDRAKLRRDIEGAKEYLRLSYDVGGSGVKVKPNALPEVVPVERTIEQIGKSLNELGRFGADYGQEVRVEVHGRKTSQLPIMKLIFDVANHPNVGVCWNSNSADLSGGGLEYNFNLVKERFGATAHVREFNVGGYPYQQLINLFVKMDYAGWILLEARTKPDNPLEALAEQRTLFKQMVVKAQSRS